MLLGLRRGASLRKQHNLKDPLFLTKQCVVRMRNCDPCEDQAIAY